MNIKQAKEEVKNAVSAYLAVDELGRYEIEPGKQRPIFLMGPPGIGKTAIMQQVAEEMGIALISYSMTHHTRQSALGLPRIKEVVYQGREYVISEYTMSEIIASVYETIESTGMKHGILFLDEINCVSETLNPIMLQFLQFKTFGMHAVPEGWVVVTAGNPPEYNNSVHEFDVVTWDRLKRVDVEPNFRVWEEYAHATGIHSAVVSYLHNRQDHFYCVKNTVDGKQFVTARGWDDLSRMIHVYEKKGIPVTQLLVAQYLQEPNIAREFFLYYDLYNKYKSDYQVDDILSGTADETIKERAKKAKFDERYALLSLLLDAVSLDIYESWNSHRIMEQLTTALRKCKTMKSAEEMKQHLNEVIADNRKKYEQGRKAKSLSNAEQKLLLRLNNTLSDAIAALLKNSDAANPFRALETFFAKKRKNHMEGTERANQKLTNAFKFCDEVMDSSEQQLLLANITARPACAAFLGQYRNEEYFKHDKEMMHELRHREIYQEIVSLEL